MDAAKQWGRGAARQAEGGGQLDFEFVARWNSTTYLGTPVAQFDHP